jgi:hypothetical protein
VLDDRGSIPGRDNDGTFFSLHYHVQTISGTQPDSCPMVTGLFFPMGKAARE